MNKSGLVDAIAVSAGVPKVTAAKALDATLSAISDALTKGDSVALVGFGTFSVRHREARMGRNPSNGTAVKIPAKNSPVFSAGKGLKDAVNPPASQKAPAKLAAKAPAAGKPKKK